MLQQHRYFFEFLLRLLALLLLLASFAGYCMEETTGRKRSLRPRSPDAYLTPPGTVQPAVLTSAVVPADNRSGSKVFGEVELPLSLSAGNFARLAPGTSSGAPVSRRGAHRRRAALRPQSSALQEITELSDNKRDIFNLIISHKDARVARTMLLLLRDKQFRHSLEAFNKLNRNYRKAFFYDLHRRSITLKTYSPKAALEMPNQVGFLEAYHEVKNNNNYLYVMPLIFNALLAMLHGGVVITSQAYLQELVLRDALAMGEEDNLKAVCAALARNDSFELNSPLVGDFYQRLTLLPRGHAAGIGLGTLVALGPPVVKKLVTPVFMWPYKKVAALYLWSVKVYRTRARSKLTAEHLRNLSRIGLSDREIVRLLQSDNTQQVLATIAANRARGVKLLEIIASLPRQNSDQKPAQRRAGMYRHIDSIVVACPNASVSSEPQVKGCSWCCLHFFRVDTSAPGDPDDADLLTAAYFCLFEHNTAYIIPFAGHIITNGLMVLVIGSLAEVLPFVLAADSMGIFGRPFWNSSCAYWASVQDYPNSSNYTAPLHDLNPNPLSNLLGSAIIFSTGLGLNQISKVVHFGVKGVLKLGSKVVSLCSWCCRPRPEDIDQFDLEPGQDAPESMEYQDSDDELAERMSNLSVEDSDSEDEESEHQVSYIN